MAAEHRRLHIYIRGRVQGVGFRFFIHQLATEMGLKGWVRNSDTRVEIDVEGSNVVLNSFLVRLKNERPRGSSTEAIESTELESANFTEFKIESSV